MKHFLTFQALVPLLFSLLNQVQSQGCQVVTRAITHFTLASSDIQTGYRCDGSQMVGESKSATTWTDVAVTSGMIDQSLSSIFNLPYHLEADEFPGDGSWAKPLLAAAKEGSTNFPECSMLYIPLYKKYARIGDYCHDCMNSGDDHIDLWAGPTPDLTWTSINDLDPNVKANLVKCGSELGRKEGLQIVSHASKGMEVSRQSSLSYPFETLWQGGGFPCCHRSDCMPSITESCTSHTLSEPRRRLRPCSRIPRRIW